MLQKAMIVPIIRKKSLSVEDFRAYWRAVHGPVAARLTGLDFYEQLHLAHPEHFFGIADPVYGSEGIDGIAVLGFLSEAHLEAYRMAASIMQADEVNVFSFAVRYETVVQSIGSDPSALSWPNIMPNRKGYLVLLQKQAEATDDAFFAQVGEAISAYNPNLNEPNAWVDFVHTRETSAPLNANIDRFTPLERQFQAVVRFASEEERAIENLISRLSKVDSIKFGRVSRIVESYLFVVEGNMTLSALRGDEAAALIARCGANNQTSPQVSKLFAPEDRPVNAWIVS